MGLSPEATDNNAIALAKGANWAKLDQGMPWSLVDASELHVGLPHGQMGNSEVGHMNLGAGRVVAGPAADRSRNRGRQPREETGARGHSSPRLKATARGRAT